jgi:hypothetical protein
VVLPRGGGRLLLASDGLWDSVTPKTALHHVRGLPASKAAAELVRLLLCCPVRRLVLHPRGCCYMGVPGKGGRWKHSPSAPCSCCCCMLWMRCSLHGTCAGQHVPAGQEAAR